MKSSPDMYDVILLHVQISNNAGLEMAPKLAFYNQWPWLDLTYGSDFFSKCDIFPKLKKKLTITCLIKKFLETAL